MGYQWCQGSTGDTNGIIAGATNSVFVTPALSTNVSFWVNVMNGAGLADSQPALVTVLQPAGIGPIYRRSPQAQLSSSSSICCFSISRDEDENAG